MLPPDPRESVGALLGVERHGSELPLSHRCNHGCQGALLVVAVNAQRNGLLYGLFAVLVSVAMGWIAGRLFALV